MSEELELLQLELRDGDDVVVLRQRVARAARLVGLVAADVTRVATSVSELGRLALRHLPASVHVRVRWPGHGVPPVLEVAVHLVGAGQALERDHHVRVALARLMDQLDVGEHCITVSKALARDLTEADVSTAREQLLLDSPADLRAALQSQNAELLNALVSLREREAELKQLNDELEETNRGVVALYAQLEQRAGELRAAQRLVFEELEAALRPPPVAVPGVELDVRYLPAQTNSPTGGDLYDWVVLPDGVLHVTVVDVQGHGVGSTRDALLVTHAVRTLVLEGHLFGQVLARVDGLLQQVGGSVVATVLLAQLDPATGVLRLAGAGHPPALRTAPGAEPVYLEAPGRPVGYPQAGNDQVTSVTLDPGDVVLLYTDGLIELRRDILEGLDTLVDAARKARELPVPQMLDTVLTACAQGDPFTDDTLLLALRWTG